MYRLCLEGREEGGMACREGEGKRIVLALGWGLFLGKRGNLLIQLWLEGDIRRESDYWLNGTNS